MSWAQRVSSCLAKVLPFHNRRTVCPPGNLKPARTTQPPLIVASIDRSGTHLMMDLVFNHFSAYRRHPLYLDLLLCEWEGRFPGRSDLEAAGGYVVKTHYDHDLYAGQLHLERIEDLIGMGAIVIVLERDRDALRRAQKSFRGEGFDEEVFERRVDSFFRFWTPRQTCRIRFEDLVDREGFAAVVRRMGRLLNMTPGPLVYPRGPQQAGRNYLEKLATRLLGHRAPVISTGIGFRKTRHDGS